MSVTTGQSELGDRHVAVLWDRLVDGAILRIAVYPDHDMTYCGLWQRDDLHLGSAIVPVHSGMNGLFTAGTVELDDGHSVVHFVAHWSVRSRGEDGSCVAAEARLIDNRTGATTHLGLRQGGETPASPRPQMQMYSG